MQDLGFFSPTELAEMSRTQKTSTIPKCGMCGLYRTARAPRMKPTGSNRLNVLVVAEAPGAEEDAYVNPTTGQKGKQLIGKAGRFTREILQDIHVKLDRDCLKTNAVICRPPHNETPTDAVIDACRPNLIATIEKYKPKTIILLGNTAIHALIPSLWKETSIGELGRWIGWNIPCQKYNAWICPAWHPSYMVRSHHPTRNAIFTEHLRKAFKHKRRPWKQVPDYEKEVECIYRPSQAAIVLREFARKRHGRITFDFEANCIKPEYAGSELVSCSVCYDGKRTIAYPWQGEAIDATAELLRTPLPKIAANMKYEERWTFNKLGIHVRNWFWDVLLAAHALDNRKHVPSVEFLEFVLLGMASHKAHIKPFLDPGRHKHINRIRELDMPTLLRYNGLDSRTEDAMAVKQIKAMKRLAKNQRKHERDWPMEMGPWQWYA